MIHFNEGWIVRGVTALAFLCGIAAPAFAADELVFNVQGAESDLEKQLKSASLLNMAFDDNVVTPRDLLAAAVADYPRLLDTLYANGYYGGVINITLDGREAALMPVISVPSNISKISVNIVPGPQFNFGVAQITPLAPNTALPPDFQTGAVARSAHIQDAVQAAALAWRNAGHAKVSVAQQDIIADHLTQTLSATVGLSLGPLVRFGDLILTNESAVRSSRILQIAGLPSGTRFSPEILSTVAKRLRRTGAFSSVTLREEALNDPSNTMDISLTVVAEKPNRFGIGAEISSTEGLTLSGYWLHRNLFGGAERFRLDAEVNGITTSGDGLDTKFGLRLERPATFGPNNLLFGFANFDYLNDPAFQSKQVDFGVGITRAFSDNLSADFAVEFGISEATDGLGTRGFTLLSLPIDATWDRRDDPLDATSGFYLRGQITPFHEMRRNAFGAHLYVDGRIYRGFGNDDQVVLAARAQAGTVITSDEDATPPDFLFYSGGGNSVRGQPYQSLNVDLGGGNVTGGHSFAAMSLEMRAKLTQSIGVVGFGDIGYIAAESMFGGANDWHAGAGLGLRYDTGIGPIRLDVALPVGGTTGNGVQFYLGIGQSF